MKPEVIPGNQKIPEQHTWKTHKTKKSSHTGHCTYTW